jgi:hypothetical protein
MSALAGAQTVTSTATTESTTTTAGTVSEISPDTLVVRTETSATPIRYSFTKTTQYVDETGAPVSLEVVKSGLPVTVQYIREGDRMIASRVTVRRQTTSAPAPTVIERNTTITQPPTVVEKPVIVEKKVPVVVDRPVVVEKPVIVERPVKRAPQLIEEKTTTTTTTTDRK